MTGLGPDQAATPHAAATRMPATMSEPMSDLVRQADARDQRPPASPDNFEKRVFRSTLIVLATIAGAYVMWRLIDLLLLLFACALMALILLTIADSIRKRAGLPFAPALGLSVLVLLALLTGAFWFFGATMQSEFAELAGRLPEAWAEFQKRPRTSRRAARRSSTRRPPRSGRWEERSPASRSCSSAGSTSPPSRRSTGSAFSA